MLLGSPPDTVHGAALRGTDLSSLLIWGRQHILPPGTGIHPCCSGLQVQGTANSPTSAALFRTGAAEKTSYFILSTPSRLPADTQRLRILYHALAKLSTRFSACQKSGVATFLTADFNARAKWIHPARILCRLRRRRIHGPCGPSPRTARVPASHLVANPGNFFAA